MILTQDNEYAVVLDACVAAPMPLCDTLLRLAEDPAFYRIFWSEQLLAEVERTLVNRFQYTPEQGARRIRTMNECFPEALVNVPQSLIDSIKDVPDQNDRHVIGAAILGRANAIVTHNIKDFPASVLKDYDILCQTPDDFLIHQFHLGPDVLMEKLDAQASAIRQQRKDVIQRLAQMAPEFAKLASSKS